MSWRREGMGIILEGSETPDTKDWKKSTGTEAARFNALYRAGYSKLRILVGCMAVFDVSLAVLVGYISLP